MNDPIEIAQKRESVSLGYPLIAVTLSLIAIVTTFVLANSGLEFPEKIGVFSVIVAIFLAGCVGAYVWQKRTLEPKTEQVAEPEPPSGISAHDIDRGLEALDEANYFFSGSLKPSDTFRLVSNRVHDLLPFRSIVLYLLNETRTQLRITAAEGVDVENQKGKTLGYDEGLAGQCYTNKRVEIDAYLMPDNSQKLGSSVAIPLCRGHEVFGVLQLSFGHEFEINAADHSVFAAVGTRARWNCVVWPPPTLA